MRFNSGEYTVKNKERALSAPKSAPVSERPLTDGWTHYQAQLRFSLQRLTKGIKASNHKVGIDTACRTKGDQIIVEIEKS